MTEGQVLETLRRRQDVEETQAAYARRIGVSPQYLFDVFSGRRKIGPAILEFLEIEKDINFRPRREIVRAK